MSKNRLLALFCTWIIVAASGASAVGHVEVAKKGAYYEVNIDAAVGANHFDLGKEYGEKIQQANPAFEQQIDLYLFQSFKLFELSSEVLHRRVDKLMKQMPVEYRQEIDGLAASFHGVGDVLKDGLLSSFELYLYNLLIDVIQISACSGIAVYGDASETGTTIIGRNYDWFPGFTIQDLNNAVTTIRDAGRTLTMIGWLGFIGAHTGYSNSVYAAYTWSGTDTKFIARDRYSIVMAIRYALEHFGTIDSVAAYLKDENRIFAFNNNVIIADEHRSVVLENNFSDPFNLPTIRREPRTPESALRQNVAWGYDNTICVVNSFVLDGNSDNHTGIKENTYRWRNFGKLTGQLGADKLSFADIQRIMSYKDPADIRGDIYKMRPIAAENDYYPTMQSVICEIKSGRLACYFQRTSTPPVKPLFETVGGTTGPQAAPGTAPAPRRGVSVLRTTGNSIILRNNTPLQATAEAYSLLGRKILSARIAPRSSARIGVRMLENGVAVLRTTEGGAPRGYTVLLP